jgi:hypothetical protein
VVAMEAGDWAVARFGWRSVVAPPAMVRPAILRNSLRKSCTGDLPDADVDCRLKLRDRF